MNKDLYFEMLEEMINKYNITEVDNFVVEFSNVVGLLTNDNKEQITPILTFVINKYQGLKEDQKKEMLEEEIKNLFFQAKILKERSYGEI